MPPFHSATMCDLTTKFSSFRVFSPNFEGDKLSPWPFFKGQFQLQCGIGPMVQPGSNPMWQMVKTHVIRLRGVEGWNTRNQIAFFCLPFILSGSPNECWIHTCDACIITTWRLGLQVPRGTCNNKDDFW